MSQDLVSLYFDILFSYIVRILTYTDTGAYVFPNSISTVGVGTAATTLCGP